MWKYCYWMSQSVELIRWIIFRQISGGFLVFRLHRGEQINKPFPWRSQAWSKQRRRKYFSVYTKHNLMDRYWMIIFVYYNLLITAFNTSFFTAKITFLNLLNAHTQIKKVIFYSKKDPLEGLNVMMQKLF